MVPPKHFKLRYPVSWLYKSLIRGEYSRPWPAVNCDDLAGKFEEDGSSTMGPSVAQRIHSHVSLLRVQISDGEYPLPRRCTCLPGGRPVQSQPHSSQNDAIEPLKNSAISE